MTDVAVEALVGVFAHGTGVVNDEVGKDAVCHRHVPARFEQAGNALGIVRVHLTPVGADFVRARGHSVKFTRALPPADALEPPVPKTVW